MEEEKVVQPEQTETVQQLKVTREFYLVDKLELDGARELYRKKAKKMKERKILFKKDKEEIQSLLTRTAMIDLIVANSPVIPMSFSNDKPEEKLEEKP